MGSKVEEINNNSSTSKIIDLEAIDKKINLYSMVVINIFLDV